jgi:hypothetical protein
MYTLWTGLEGTMSRFYAYENTLDRICLCWRIVALRVLGARPEPARAAPVETIPELLDWHRTPFSRVTLQVTLEEKSTALE